MKNIKLLTIILIFPFILASCGKYEDGPFFSIYTKTERITGYWRFDRVTEGGVNKTENYVEQSLELYRNGVANWTKGYRNNNPYDPIIHTGTWDFRNDKEYVLMKFNIGSAEEYQLYWKITKLAYADLRLERYDEVLGKIEWRLWKR